LLIVRTSELGWRCRLAALGVATVIVLAGAPPARAQGVTLDQYRAAETTRDGFVVTRPVGLGHLGVSASLHVDYGLEPLRGPASRAGGTLVDHQLTGQLGVALGVLDRLVVALRVPVVLLLSGRTGTAGDPATRDPIASGAGLGDVALSLRAVLLDDALFAVALQAEASIPPAEAIAPSQDLAGEAGVSFTPELAAELRLSPVRITANLGARFRQPAAYQTLRVEHELTWAAGVGVDIVPDVLDATLEGYGATPLTRFATASLSPVELLLGVRVRPIRELVIGLAGGPGLGDGYGAPVFRGVLTVGLLALPEIAQPVVEEGSSPVEAHEDSDTEDSSPTDTTEGTTEGTDSAEGPDAIEAPPPEPEALRTAVEPFSRDDYGQLDRDGDRIVDAEDQCLLDREDYDEIQDADGCPEENADEDPVADVDDVCPLTPGVASDDATVTGCPARAYIGERGAIVIRDRVEFATGSDRILPASTAVLNDVLSILQSSPDVTRVRIEGHTDDQGTDRANIRLSRARAASVRRWLVTHGIAAERLEAWGCGELHPLEQARTRQARQTNRRVEFFVVEPRSSDLVLRERCVEAP
jgi:outer membrane protein OmpA-like peptidoglycan-associated protein